MSRSVRLRQTSQCLLRPLARLVAVACIAAPLTGVVVAPAGAATAPGPTTHKVAYQCDTTKPGYGTNTTGGVYFDTVVGDTVEITMNGGSCRQGGMHVMGETSQISWSPANTSCCSYIASGTTYRVSVLKKDAGSNGGWINIPFFGPTYGGIEHVRFKIAQAPQPPAPPTNLAAVPGETGVGLSFTEGDLFGQPLIGNEVQIDGGPWQPLAADGQVSGLSPDTTYSLRVRHVSSVGTGLPSEVLSARTSAQVGSVTKSLIYQCDQKKPGYGSRTIGGDFIDVEVGDRILATFDGPDCLTGSMHISGDGNQVVLTGFNPYNCCQRIPSGSRWVVDVVASTGANGAPGYWRQPLYSTTAGYLNDLPLRIASAAPPAPVITKASRVGNTIVVEFTQEPSKLPITGYEYVFENSEYSLRWSDPTKVVPGGQVSSPLVIPTDWNGALSHFIKLRAVNSAGPGAVAVGEAPPSLTRPGSPTDEVAEPGDRQVFYSWTPATPGSAPIKEYEVRVYSYTPRSKLVQRFRTTSTSVMVTGLTNGVKYEFLSQAYDVDGEFGFGSYGVYAVPNRAPVVTDICHADGDGYQRITITFDPLKGDTHYSHGGDIVPPVAGRAGVNWDEKGTAIFENNCVEILPPDTDEDGIIDLEDADDDGDGVPDVSDSDDDGDGVRDSIDADQPLKTDVDSDGVPNSIDPDDDGDGIQDAVDADSDGDTIDDNVDNDVVQAVDSDLDELPDAIDPDDDGDCIADVRDSDRDGDGVRDSRDSDLDNDGVPNGLDADDDGDGLADAVDADANADGSVDSIEANESDSTRSGSQASSRARECAVVADDNADVDGDGVSNAADRDDDGDGTPDTADEDRDGDGIPNEEDADEDGDGIVNTEDRDSTGLTDPTEADSDGDGVPNTKDKDDDGDGVTDVRDGDADGDGQPETVGQVLVASTELPRSLPSDGTVTLLKDASRTNARQRAQVVVTCDPAPGVTRSKVAGGVAASELRSCGVRQVDGKTLLDVRAAAPTRVTVRVTAPATGRHLRMEVVRTYRVGFSQG